jgi:hypothetical protein
VLLRKQPTLTPSLLVNKYKNYSDHVTGNSGDLSWSRSWAQAAKMKSVFTETAKKKKPAQKILATVWLLKYGT